MASSTLYFRPRDMAKIGQMRLDKGMWNGTRVVSGGWTSRSTRQAVGMVESPVPGLSPGYGYLWWLGTFAAGGTETYFAAGWGGQFVFVLPEPGVVVVLTAGRFADRDYAPLLRIVNDYLLPAVGR